MRFRIPAGISAEETRIAGAIFRRKGKKRAIQVEVLASDHEIDGRRVRRMVKGLIEDHGLPILSSTGRFSGYYIPGDVGEVKACIKSLRRRAASCLGRANTLEKALRMSEQLEI